MDKREMNRRRFWSHDAGTVPHIYFFILRDYLYISVWSDRNTPAFLAKKCGKAKALSDADVFIMLLRLV